MRDVYYTAISLDAFNELFESLPPVARLTDPSFPGANLILTFPGGKIILYIRKEENAKESKGSV